MSIFLIDSAREDAIEIGRYYEYPTLPAGACIIHQGLASGYLNDVQVGDNLTLALDIQTLYDTLIDQFGLGKKTPSVVKSTTGYSLTNITCQVAYLTPKSYGKFTEDTAERSIIMELEPFMGALSQVLPAEIATQKGGKDFAKFVADLKS